MKKNGVNILRYFIFIGLFCIVILPLIFIFITSFKSNDEIFMNPWGMPEDFSIASYVQVFTEYKILRFLVNSIVYASVVCVVVVIISSMASYAIARMHWKFNKVCMNYFLLGIMIPIHSLLVPLYISVSRMRITNVVALILIYIANSVPTAIFILTGYLAAIPVELEEAAVIDGASVRNLFLKVIVPLLKPSVATITILTFLGIWNDLMMGLIFLTKENNKTIQLFISQFKGDHFTNYSVLLSSIIISTVPMIIVYLFMSDRLINGMTAGAVKG